MTGDEAIVFFNSVYTVQYKCSHPAPLPRHDAAPLPGRDCPLPGRCAALTELRGVEAAETVALVQGVVR